MESSETPPPITTSDVLVDLAEKLTKPKREAYNWVSVYTELFGPRSLFMKFVAANPDSRAMNDLFGSRCVREGLTRISELRKRYRAGKDYEEEPVRVITMRVPKRVHESLIVEAAVLKTSLNQLCISKILTPPLPESIVPVSAAPSPRLSKL